MPPESNTRSPKAPGRPGRALVVIVIGLLATLMLDTAMGQELPFLQQPYLPPARPARSRGLFYLNAGVKFRNVQQISFETRDTQLINITQRGVPAFGPEVPDLLNYPPTPTGIATDNPQFSGIWLYNDGFIEPTGDIGESWTVPPANGIVNIGSSIRYRKYVRDGSILGKVTDDPQGVATGSDIGSFFVSDLQAQADDNTLSTPSDTKHFSFTKMVDGLTPGIYQFILSHKNNPGLPPPGVTKVPSINETANGDPFNGPAPGNVYQATGATGSWGEIPSIGFGAVPRVWR